MRLGLLLLPLSLGLVVSAAPEAETVDDLQTAGVSLLSNLPSGQAVGTTVTWTVTSTSPDPTSYRLSVAPPGEPLRLMYDFSPDNVFEWTPIDDGVYLVLASARNDVTGAVDTNAVLFAVTPRAFGWPVITPTPNALVALYSAPACDSGTMQVLFRPQGGLVAFSTARKPCRPGRTMNFYVAGMLVETDYWMRHVQAVGGTPVAQGPLVRFRTGPLPPALVTLPVNALLDPPDPSTSPEAVLLVSPITRPADPVPVIPFATDLTGRLIWYDDQAPATNPHMYRLVDGGTMLLVQSKDDVESQVLREIDLAGDTLRQTTAARISEQLLAMGYTDPFTAFHHEARRLPNGQTVVLGATERILVDVQGPGAVDVLADYIVILDRNWQVVWAWSGFDHLDVGRAAILGETCTSQGPGCPVLVLDTIANDWLHSNAIAYSPGDGNLLVSVRHQDWIVKIDYRDGAGDGHVIWRLGPGGDFTLASSDPFPWFSHQHDPNLTADGRIVVYDNGNTRCAQTGTCASRGQVYDIDESAMTAALLLDADLGNYSEALGAAQLLSNGNYFFTSGFQTPPFFTSWSDEVRLDGTKTYSLQIESGVYRSFRVRDLYTAPKR